MRREKRQRLLDSGREPYPVRVPRTHTIPQVRAALPGPRARHRHRRRRRDRGPRHLRPQHRQALLRDAAGRRRHRHPGDALARPGRRGVARRLEGATSTSATTSSVEGEVISSRGAASFSMLADVLADRGQGAAAAAESARRAQRGDAGAPALPRPDRARRRRARLSSRCARGRSPRCARRFAARGFIEVETPMLQTHARRRVRAPVRHALERVRHRRCTCASRPSCSSSAAWSAASTGSSRSTATSATRAPTPRTRPSSRCSRSTRRTATTTRSPTSPGS